MKRLLLSMWFLSDSQRSFASLSLSINIISQKLFWHNSQQFLHEQARLSTFSFALIETRCRHAKRRSSFLEDVAFTHCFLFPARRLSIVNLHFQFRAGAGLPHTATGQQPAPYRGMVLGKSHFDFSMLVFSGNFPTDTKSRRKRTKTADAVAWSRNKTTYRWNYSPSVGCFNYYKELQSMHCSYYSESFLMRSVSLFPRAFIKPFYGHKSAVVLSIWQPTLRIFFHFFAIGSKIDFSTIKREERIGKPH